MRRPAPSRPATDGESTADDLVRLVLALVETLRQLIERQAIRRVEGGHLREDDIERLGLALLRLEQRMDELKAHFGLQDEDLSLRLDLGGCSTPRRGRAKAPRLNNAMTQPRYAATARQFAGSR